MSELARKSPADFAASDHPDTISMRDLASMNYHLCVDDIYTKDQKMQHAYNFGMMVCNQTIRYTEEAKHSEKVHRKQRESWRREVEGLRQDLRTSQASLSSTQTDLDATQNELDDLHCTNASQELDNLDCSTASQDTDSSQPRLCSSRVDDHMDENGSGDPLPGP
ncbi:unnamed protein product [Arctogadus glacialis]